MKNGRKETNYLLLDISDVTFICGSMTTTQLMSKLNMSRNQLTNWLNNSGILENKYIVVEESL